MRRERPRSIRSPRLEPPRSAPADAATIHDLIRQWNAAAQAKDPAAFTTVYAEDAVVMLAAAPDLRGLPAIREGIAGMMKDPNFRLSFTPDQVTVAGAGDLAYETGTYTMTMSGSDGRPMQDQGSYVVVWRKQADGRWMVVVDAPISDVAGAAH